MSENTTKDALIGAIFERLVLTTNRGAKKLQCIHVPAPGINQDDETNYLSNSRMVEQKNPCIAEKCWSWLQLSNGVGTCRHVLPVDLYGKLVTQIVERIEE